LHSPRRGGGGDGGDGGGGGDEPHVVGTPLHLAIFGFIIRIFLQASTNPQAAGLGTGLGIGLGALGGVPPHSVGTPLHPGLFGSLCRINLHALTFPQASAKDGVDRQSCQQSVSLLSQTFSQPPPNGMDDEWKTHQKRHEKNKIGVFMALIQLP